MRHAGCLAGGSGCAHQFKKNEIQNLNNNKNNNKKINLLTLI